MNSGITRAVLTAAIFTAISAPARALDISTNASNRYQTIEGWGTSGSHSVMNSSSWRAAYRDLGLNIFRVGLEFTALTPERTDYNNNGVLESNEADYRIRVPLIGNTLQQNVDKFNFNLTPGESAAGNFSAWLSQNALELERVRVVGSSWTPPHWMKGPTGMSQNFVGITANYPTPWLAGSAPEVTWLPDGQGDSIGGRLRTEDSVNLAEFGQYLAAHVAAFEQRFGVDMYALSLQNESTFENPFISMVLNKNQSGADDYSQYNLALKSVRDAWQQWGLDTKIKGPHVAQVGPTPQSPWSLLMQMNYIEALKADSDPTLIDFLDFYNSNYYMPFDEAGVQATAGYYHGRNEVAAPWVFWTKAPGVDNDGKPIWYSETGGAANAWINGSGGTVGNGAITVALKMFNALVHSDASSYIYWQFTDGNQSDSTEHSLIGLQDLLNPNQSEKYVAFKHFSRFVRPGARRIDANFSNGFASLGGQSQYDTLHAVNVSAFLNEEDQMLTYVLLNMENSAESISIDLPEGFHFNSFDVYRSSETERFAQLAELVVQNGQITFSMPRYTIVTLVGNFLAPLAGDYNDDGNVDAADYAVWRKYPGGFGGDPDGFNAWRENFGTSTGSGAGGASGEISVPEPSCLAIVLLVLLLAGTGNRVVTFESVGERSKWYQHIRSKRPPGQ